jgi:hypothetical protein
MTISLVGAPDLAPLAQGSPTLLLVQGLGFSSDGKQLLVQANFSDSAESTFQQHYGVWIYDLATQNYLIHLNGLLSSGANGAKTVDVEYAVIAGKSSGSTLVAQYSLRGTTETPFLALIINGVVTDANVLASFAGAGADIDVSKFALSQDGRFLAVQTSSGILMPEGSIPDANELDDVYLLDLKNHFTTRVSVVSGQEGGSPTVLGNVMVSGSTVSVSFTTASSFATQDSNSTASVDAANDAYVWTSSFNTTGLFGNASLKVVSIAANKATGWVDASLGETITTATGTYFNSSSDAYKADDTNGVTDPFVMGSDGVVRYVQISNQVNLSTGAVVAAANENGKIVALLTHSPEVAGTTGAEKLVVINSVSGTSMVASEGVLSADGSVTSAVLSSDGALVAFTSEATNITSSSPPASGGSLYVATTGFKSTTGFDINGTITQWRTHAALKEVNLAQDGQSTATLGDGLFGFSGINDTDGTADGKVQMSPAKLPPVTKTDAGITLTDVLAALKVYLGKPLPTDYSSPYNYIAADFDGNGAVTLSDVLNLLKFYLNKPTGAVVPQWVFVDSSTSLAANEQALSKTNAFPHPVIHDLNETTTVHLVGILRGDVDGSYAGS